MMMSVRFRSCSLFVICVALAALAACASAPPMPPAPTAAELEAMVAKIKASAGSDETELAVQPLRDPNVEDLRQEAERLETQKRYAEAADRLDKAIAITPDDPALLQDRAEAAVLLNDFDGAERFARRAYGIGSKVGPLCRRHWTTVEVVRLAQGQTVAAAGAARKVEEQEQKLRQTATYAAEAAQASEQAKACTVAAPDRF
jgi:tetratricopeptide (TPR) repeat protein